MLAAAALFITTRASAQNTAHSTHDWVVPGGVVKAPLNETWADVKSPGGGDLNRFIYSVGTAAIGASSWGFSGAGVGVSPGMAFGLPTPGLRQVAILQAVTDLSPMAGRPIAWQQYFYGLTPGVFDRATNARGVSVWRAAAPADSRIAICGETYDQSLPLSQAPAGWAAASPAAPSGFIAVYDGNGVLLWTHHFFAGANPANACAITDVSIRVDAGVDVVTYCGISSHGLPAAGTALSPLREFLAPGPACNGGAPATPPGQWDGIVGRVTFAGGPSVRVFHSIVGALGQDGLFGIAEIDADRFAVVGSAQADPQVGGFPSTAVCGALGPYAVGTLLIFNASGLGPVGLTSSEFLGSLAANVHSIARDVCVGYGTRLDTQFGENLLYIVGSTDDAGFIGPLYPVAPPPAAAVLNGPTDGFIAAFWETGFRWTASFHGGPGGDGLTGVNCWNEFGEHVSVTGFTDDGAGGVDIDCGTYFFDNAFGPVPPAGSTAPANFGLALNPIRRTQVGGTGEDRPAVMGPINATTFGLGFATFGLGQESGGGVAVGPTGRTNVVGRTLTGFGYPVVGGRAASPGFSFDAVRTELDMVLATPVGVAGPGTGRTDGTGFQPAVPFPTPGFDGGTTPICALAEFGRQIGMPVPGLQRMLIDYQGALGLGSTDPAILLSRPTPDPLGGVGFTITVLQLAPPPAIPQFPAAGVELWFNPALPSATLADVTMPGQLFRLPIVPLTQTGFTFTIQIGALLSNPVGGGAPCSSVFTAGPAIFFSF